jgi:hypothetical protein
MSKLLDDKRAEIAQHLEAASHGLTELADMLAAQLQTETDSGKRGALEELRKQAHDAAVDLKDKLAAAELREVELGEQRDALAFNAHTGDTMANKALAKITRELIEHEQHTLSLHAPCARVSREF